MTDHAADTTRVGLTHLHAILGLAHLARGDHFHGTGDLLRALDARDLGADFLADCHRCVSGLSRSAWLLNFSISSAKAPAISSL
jgi:hypothetical protein